MSATGGIDFDKLLRLRLVVARFGEMDGAQWWNTRGVLGRKGTLLMSRGFAKTHRFAQAKVVFAVATARSREVFDPPKSMTLWKLPAHVEDEFDAQWHRWLSNREHWEPFFEELQRLPSNDLLQVLLRFALITPSQAQEIGKLKRSAEGKAVAIPGLHQPNDELLTLLAAGFSKGETGRLSIPYARLEDG